MVYKLNLFKLHLFSSRCAILEWQNLQLSKEEKVFSYLVAFSLSNCSTTAAIPHTSKQNIAN